MTKQQLEQLITEAETEALEMEQFGFIVAASDARQLAAAARAKLEQMERMERAGAEYLELLSVATIEETRGMSSKNRAGACMYAAGLHGVDARELASFLAHQTDSTDGLGHTSL